MDKTFYEYGKPNNFLTKWATVDSKPVTAASRWNSIDWKTAQRRINKLQTRITKATARGNGNLVKKLQHLLTSSFFAKTLAVKHVTSNKGKRTAGIDNQLWKSPTAKYKAAQSLITKGYKAKPLRRIYIEKKGKNKKRPLGIPTMYDRSIQALYAMALDPVAEATADRTSFGFRKNRGTMDAAQHIFFYSYGNKGTQWILEGDIKGCFDNINHQWLMENIPINKKILKQLLKAGFSYKRQLFPTERGTPQGGILSPIMANMTLDGIEKKIMTSIKEMIHLYRGKSQRELIKTLNPIITGWANYHHNSCAKQTYSDIDSYLFHKLWKWAKRRHPNKNCKWVKKRYWHSNLFSNWIFSDGDIILKKLRETRIIRHWLIKFDANPYLPCYNRYYEYRRKQRAQRRKYGIAANGIFG